MSMTRHRMPGLALTFRLNISEITTLEKSILVMSLKPKSYRCSERRELPQPGTRICIGDAVPAEVSDAGAPPGGASAESCARRGSLSSDHSAYHSKESSLPRILKKLSQFSLLVKSPSVWSSCSAPFFSISTFYVWNCSQCSLELSSTVFIVEV